MDAAIAPYGKAILVDHEALHGWEIHVRWREQRFRFSVAHELGHYFLHATNMKEVSFDSIEGFKQWVLLHQGDRTAEYQADEFAARLSRSTKRIRLRVATQRRVEVYGGHWTAGDTWSIPFVGYPSSHTLSATLRRTASSGPVRQFMPMPVPMCML